MPAEYTHSPAPEEIMEYLDGEGTAASRDAIAVHLTTCAACQAIAAEQRGISQDAQAWTVAAAPASLHAPAAPRARVLSFAFWRPSRVALAAVGAAAAVFIVIAVGSRTLKVGQLKAPSQLDAVSLSSAAESAKRSIAAAPIPEAPAASRPRQEVPLPLAGPAPRAPMVIRTATLHIVAKDFGNVRQTVEGIVSQAGGFLDQMTVTGDTSTARQLRGRLRVPGDRLAAALTRLRQIGQIVEDTQGAEDVTDQIVDLDARLASARATEQRLTELLRTRTGKLSDVLEVEREITRVRLDIERLDAEKTNMGRRVSYSTIDLLVAEERKANLDAGPLSLATRIRIAAADGLESALESVALTLLFLLRAGPSLLLWGFGAGMVWAALRRFKSSLKPRASE